MFHIWNRRILGIVSELFLSHWSDTVLAEWQRQIPGVSKARRLWAGDAAATQVVAGPAKCLCSMSLRGWDKHAFKKTAASSYYMLLNRYK
eukprot:s3773_g11.t1